jgi:lysophospholipase L1-like esterase
MRAWLAVPLCALTLSCGGSSPTAPTPEIVDHVTLVAFLDENRNGVMDPLEDVRIPGAEVSMGAVSGRTASRTGAVTLDVPRGSYPPSVRESSLPPYYLAPSAAPPANTQAGTVLVPVTLPAGPAPLAQATYVAFGDSITNGEGFVGDGAGYRGLLGQRLRDTFGVARIANEGVNSSDTNAGLRRLVDVLAFHRPQFILILYGTNDWNDGACGQPPCFTIDNLQSMIRISKANGTQVFLGTLLPTNAGFNSEATEERNDWVVAQNRFIVDLARSESVVLVDLHKAFDISPLSFRQLFQNSLHPSESGYAVMAEAWFNAIVGR